MKTCCICDEPLGGPVYESVKPISITSLCQVLEGNTRVWHCDFCGHTQTDPLPSLEKFYAEDYHILINSEEEDQLYSISDGKEIYRTEHQVFTYLDKYKIPENAKILDYGCGKASTLKALCTERADIMPYVFDVGEQYRPFWDDFVPRENQAVNETPEAWQGVFNGVISFFALEHVADPKAFLEGVHRLLCDGGMVYFLVPNLYANTADLVVCDHVNHFSESSLRCLLAMTGFEVKQIDPDAHNSAWVVLAKKSDVYKRVEKEGSVVDEVRGISDYWIAFGEYVRRFERTTEADSAIYGSGFYGTFIYTSLKQADSMICFIDQNPHRQKHTLMGKPIIAPDNLPDSVERIYVGLNPVVARDVFDAIQWGRDINVFYP